MSDHLSDDEIQEYLERADAEKGGAAGMHLQRCARCRRTLSSYRSIVTELGRETDFALSPRFTDRVIAAVTDDAPALFGIRISDTLFSTVGFIVGLGVSMLLVDFKSIGRALLSLNFKNMNVFPHVYASLKAFLGNMNVNAGLLAFAVFIFLLYFLMDQFIARTKLDHSSSR